MNKFLVYTSNLREMPRTMRDVIRFAEETPKFYITSAELNDKLANAKVGDNIITSKGNSVYVLRTFDKSLEDLCREDREYIDDKTRRFGLKKSNISGVSNVIKFETWCKSAATLVNSEVQTNSKTEKKMKNSLSNFSARLKESFMPVEAKDVRIAQDGNICVETADGFVAIDANNNLTAYPEELTLALPIFVISKPVDQLHEGDIILRNSRYYKITKIADGHLSTIGYNGVGHSVKTVRDFVLGGATERVVVSLAGNIVGTGINPALMMFMSADKGSKMKDMLPFLMMSQNGGNIAGNPWMLMALAGDKEEGGKSFDIKDLFMMSALSGNNLFGGAATTPAGGLFGGLFGTAPAAPAAAPAPAAKKRPARKAKPAAAAAAAE